MTAFIPGYRADTPVPVSVEEISEHRAMLKVSRARLRPNRAVRLIRTLRAAQTKLSAFAHRGRYPEQPRALPSRSWRDCSSPSAASNPSLVPGFSASCPEDEVLSAAPSLVFEIAELCALSLSR
jgi:hypothetical protein